MAELSSVRGLWSARPLPPLLEAMEVDTQACSPTDEEETDPLDVMAGAAAVAPRAAVPKRKRGLVGGRGVCWLQGCDCEDDLEGVPRERVEDAMHTMQHEMGLELGTFKGQPRKLPDRDGHNKLCRLHRPALPRQRIIGASVLVKVSGEFLPATVMGPVLVAGSGARAARDLAAPSSPQRWVVQGEAADDGSTDMTTAEVWAAAELRRSYDASVTVAEAAAKKRYTGKINALQHKIAYDKDKLKPKPPAVPRPTTSPSPRRAPQQPTAPPPPPAAPATVARVKIRVPLPRSWLVGQPIALDVLAGYVQAPQRSRAIKLMKLPPADSIPGAFVTFDCELPLDPPPPPSVTVTKSGRKAADARRYIEERSKQLGLVYSTQPNPLNPKRSWPIRERLTFENLRPEYFELPDRAGLFRKLFGFECWEDAMLVYEQIYVWDVAAGARRKKEATAVLHPRFQFLAALWRMRRHKDQAELASFFGVRKEYMSECVPRWIRRLGRYAKANLVFLPKDFESITDMAPQAFIDCGLSSVVAIGDCTDILTEDSRENKYISNQSRSDKSKHAAAMGLTWVTPNGYIMIATDLFLGRSSEHEACKACLPALNRIPAKYALMYDKGVSKLRVHLENLNHVITPCFLRGASKFTVEQGIRNRGVTCCRYIVEVPFSNMKAWKFLGGVVPEEDKHLLNDVWWWTIGFHNLKHHILKAPAGL